MTSEQPSGNATSAQPEHELVDFVALAAQLTNEQKILATLERIEVLLTPAPTTADMLETFNKPSKAQLEHSAKIAALANKTMGRRK